MSDKNFLEEARKFTPSEKEKVVKKIERTAYYYERTFGGCARSVLRAI